MSLIGVTFALAAFPVLAARYAARDRPGSPALVVRNSLTIGTLTVGAAAGLIIFGERGIDILLGGGEFGPDDVARTAQVLAAFALSVPFESLGHLLSRAIYATHHTLWQVGASIVGFVVTIAAAVTLAESLGVVAIPLSYALGSAVRCVLLVAVLARRIRRMPSAPAAGRAGAATAHRRYDAASLARIGRQRGARLVGGHHRDRRGHGDPQPVAVGIAALGSLPRQEIALHLGPVLERPGRIGWTPDRRHPREPRVEDVGALHLRVLEDRRIGVGPEPGHHPGVRAAPGEQDDR